MAEKNTMFGKLLGQIQGIRALARKQAVDDLWKRNKLTPNSPGYKLAETVTMHRDGAEVIEYRLYKLIDASVTTVIADVKHSVETGVGAAVEMKKR